MARGVATDVLEAAEALAAREPLTLGEAALPLPGDFKLVASPETVWLLDVESSEVLEGALQSGEGDRATAGPRAVALVLGEGFRPRPEAGLEPEVPRVPRGAEALVPLERVDPGRGAPVEPLGPLAGPSSEPESSRSLSC